MRRRWLAAGSLVMGYGVWAMHFIGMLAFRLPIPVAYDVPITALSVIPAIAASVVALHVVARKDPPRWLLIAGGALMGAGIGAMHYTGMGAMRLNAEMRYDPLLFGGSIVVAKAPDLGDLSDGKTIESRYEYDGERLHKAWSRKVSAEPTLN